MLRWAQEIDAVLQAGLGGCLRHGPRDSCLSDRKTCCCWRSRASVYVAEKNAEGRAFQDPRARLRSYRPANSVRTPAVLFSKQAVLLYSHLLANAPLCGCTPASVPALK